MRAIVHVHAEHIYFHFCLKGQTVARTLEDAMTGRICIMFWSLRTTDIFKLHIFLLWQNFLKVSYCDSGSTCSPLFSESDHSPQYSEFDGRHTEISLKLGGPDSTVPNSKNYFSQFRSKFKNPAWWSNAPIIPQFRKNSGGCSRRAQAAHP